jgi:hypothetical protein
MGGASMAVADNTPDCPDINHQVDTSEVAGGDPYNLDNDGDGVGCESYQGPPMSLAALKHAADAKGADAPELAQTGWGPGDHPIRWIGATGTALVLGAGMVVAGRRRSN